jgi:hypothetical protein
MQLLLRELRNALSCFALFGLIGLAGCANTCFVGVVNNGSGSLGVAAGNPPPVCSTTATGAIRVTALKSPACETCTAAARADHVFVTLRGIQLRSDAPNGRDTAEWLEIAPELANEPIQIDLIGHSEHKLFMKNTVVPAGSYREVRLQFLSDAKLAPDNACGDTRSNCVVLADGSTKSLQWTKDAPELLMTIQNGDSDLLVVLPDGVLELQLSLEADQVPYFSPTEGWKLVSVLVGHASAI